MINPLREKYHHMYWQMAYVAASQSTSIKRSVGAVVVTPSGMISVGWNAMPSGHSNDCETEGLLPNADELHVCDQRGLITKPEVIHAERNCIDKMTKQGVSTLGSLLFVTYAPCFECAKAIHGLGFEAIHYDHIKHTQGVDFLKSCNLSVHQR